MDTKKIIAILKNMVSNKREVDRGDQLELSFNVENNDSNRTIFNDNEMREYNVEEVAELINQIDVDSLSPDDIEYIKSLHRKLESDNVNNNIYKNEEALIGPLSQIITSHKHLIEEKGFNSNQRALNDLISNNNNLVGAKMISLKPDTSDSNYTLDYIRIVNDGETELIAITDPDYLERFVNEFPDDINKMTASEFANRLKTLTESNLEFVRLEDYLTKPEIKSKMHSPAIKDYNVLSYEAEEVKRLVDKFMPNEEIFITIDKYGEIFYKVADGIIKGRTENNQRIVEFSVVPSSLISNEKTMVEESKEENVIQDNAKQNIPEEKSVGNMEVQVIFDANKFVPLYENRKDIISGNDPEKKSELFSQLNALFDLCYKQEVDPQLIKMMANYYLENVSRYEMAKGSDNMVNQDIMSIQEFNLMKKLDDAYKQVDKEQMKEEVKEEIDEFGIQGDTKKEEETFHNGFYHPPKSKKPKNNHGTNHGISMIAIIIEILTVALVIMMFLSLDI